MAAKTTGLFDDFLQPAAAKTTGLFDDFLSAPSQASIGPDTQFRDAARAADRAAMSHTRPRPADTPWGVAPEPTSTPLEAAMQLMTPAPGWDEVLSQDLPTAARATGAGAIAGSKLKFWEDALQEQALTDPSWTRLHGADLEAKIANERGVISGAEADLQALRDQPRSLVQRAVPQAGSSLMLSAMGLATGAITRNPAAALAAIAPPTFGLKYGELRNAGAPLDLANTHAAIETGLEVGTEALPFHYLFRPGLGMWNRLLSVIAAEEGGETVAALTQGVNDHVAALRIAGKPVTQEEIVRGLAQAAAYLPETWISTALASGVQTGTVQPALESAAARQLRKQYDAALAEAADYDARLALDPMQAQMELVYPEEVAEPAPPAIGDMLLPETAQTLSGGYSIADVSYTGLFADFLGSPQETVTPEVTAASPAPEAVRAPSPRTQADSPVFTAEGPATSAPAASPGTPFIYSGYDADLNRAYEEVAGTSKDTPTSLQGRVGSLRDFLQTRPSLPVRISRVLSQQGATDEDFRNVGELREVLREWDLPLKGKRADLFERVRRAHEIAWQAETTEDLSSYTLAVLRPMAEAVGLQPRYMNKAELVEALRTRRHEMRRRLVMLGSLEPYRKSVMKFLRTEGPALTEEEYTFLQRETGFTPSKWEAAVREAGKFPAEIDAAEEARKEEAARKKAETPPAVGTFGRFGASPVQVTGPAKPDSEGYPQVEVTVLSGVSQGKTLTIRAAALQPPPPQRNWKKELVQLLRASKGGMTEVEIRKALEEIAKGDGAGISGVPYGDNEAYGLKRSSYIRYVVDDMVDGDIAGVEAGVRGTSIVFYAKGQKPDDVKSDADFGEDSNRVSIEYPSKEKPDDKPESEETDEDYYGQEDEAPAAPAPAPAQPEPSPASLEDRAAGRTRPVPAAVVQQEGTPVSSADPVQRTLMRRADALEAALKRKAEKTPDIMPKRDTPLGASTLDTLFKEMVQPRPGESMESLLDRRMKFADRMRNAGLAAQLRAARQFIKVRFHFADVAIPKGASPREALDVILDLFNNADTLAAITGLPRGAIGMGIITLHLPKTLGNKYTRGMFSWGMHAGNVLSIARRSDSFAHEWFHSIDVWIMQHLMGAQRAGIASGRIGATLAPDPIIRAASPELEAALRDLLRHVYFDLTEAQFEKLERLAHEEYVLTLQSSSRSNSTEVQSAKARLPVVRQEIAALLKSSLGAQAQGSLYQDQLSGQPYFSQPWEMLARAMEAYVASVVGAAKGTEIISAPPGFYTDPTDQMRSVYPGDLERQRIFASIARFFDVLGEVYQFSGQRAQDRRETAANSPRLMTQLVLESQQTPELQWVPRVVRSLQRDASALRAAVSTTLQFAQNSLSQPRTSYERLAEVMRRTNDAVVAPYFYTLIGTLNSMIAKYADNDEVTQLLRQVRGKLAYDPGSGEYNPHHYQLRVEQHVSAQNAKLARVMQQQGLKEDDPDMMRDLHSILTRSTEIQLLAARNVLSRAADMLVNLRKVRQQLQGSLEIYLKEMKTRIDDEFALAVAQNAALPVDKQVVVDREAIAAKFADEVNLTRRRNQSSLDVVLESIETLERDMNMARERIETISAPESALDAREALAKEALARVSSTSDLQSAVSVLKDLLREKRAVPAQRTLADRLSWYMKTVEEIVLLARAGAMDQISAVAALSDVLRSELTRLGFERRRREQLPALRQLPERLHKAARAIRELLDEEYYYNVEAGVELGYVPNGYLPRMTNLERFETRGERVRFVAAATLVYEDMLRLEKTRVLSEMAELRRQMSQFQVSANLGQPPAESLRRQRFARLQALESEYADLQRKSPQTMAEEYVTSILVPDLHEHIRATPSARYTKGRVLPPSADDLLRDWYINNPVELVRRYLMASARRAEYARDWGQRDEILSITRDRLLAYGLSMEDWELLDLGIKVATGRYIPYLQTSRGTRAAQWGANLGTMSLLVLASFASLPEPLVYGMQTGEVMEGLKGVFKQFTYAVRTNNNRAAWELAELMGVVSDAITEQSLHNRFFWTEGQSSLLNTVMARYFKLTLIAPLTRAQRVMVSSMGFKYFHRQAAALLQGDAEAVRDFSEFGIPPKAQKAFASWLLDLGEVTPDKFVREDHEKFKQLLSRAMYRFVDIVIQNPGIETRPLGAFSSYGRLIFSIMGFALSFQRNVIVRSAKRFAAAGDGTTGLTKAQAKLAFATPWLASAGLLVLFQVLSRMLRDLWSDPTGDRLKRRVERMRDNPVLAVTDAMSGAGFTGGFDPLYQSMRFWRYEKDFAATMVGAVPGWYIQHTQNMFEGFVVDRAADQTPNSSLTERRGWESLFMMSTSLGVPLALTAANVTGVPGFVLMSALTNRGLWRNAAEHVSPKTEYELKREASKERAKERADFEKRYGVTPP